MKLIFDEVIWYCLGRKGIKHGKKENKNISNLQNFLSSELLNKNDEHLNKRFKELINAKKTKM